MKFNEKVWANTTAVFVGVVYLFCRFAIALFPGFSMAVTRSWFHGFDVARIWTPRAFSENLSFPIFQSWASHTQSLREILSQRMHSTPIGLCRFLDYENMDSVLFSPLLP